MSRPLLHTLALLFASCELEIPAVDQAGACSLLQHEVTFAIPPAQRLDEGLPQHARQDLALLHEARRATQLQQDNSSVLLGADPELVWAHTHLPHAATARTRKQGRVQQPFNIRLWACLMIAFIHILIFALLVTIVSRVLVSEVHHGINFLVCDLLGTSFELGELSTNMFTGLTTIKDLVVTNPKDFTSEHLLRVGALEVQLDVLSYIRTCGQQVRIRSVRACDLNMVIAYEGHDCLHTSTNIGLVMDRFSSRCKIRGQKLPMLSGLHACFPALLGRQPLGQQKLEMPKRTRSPKRMGSVEAVDIQNLVLSHPSFHVGSFDFQAVFGEKRLRCPEDVAQEVVHSILAYCHGRLEVQSWSEPEPSLAPLPEAVSGTCSPVPSCCDAAARLADEDAWPTSAENTPQCAEL